MGLFANINNKYQAIECLNSLEIFLNYRLYDSGYARLYNLNSNIKENLFYPIKRLKNESQRNLDYIEYTNDAIYYGMVNSNGDPSGIGFMCYPIEQGNKGDSYRDIYVGYFSNGTFNKEDGVHYHLSSEDANDYFVIDNDEHISPVTGYSRYNQSNHSKSSNSSNDESGCSTFLGCLIWIIIIFALSQCIGCS